MQDKVLFVDDEPNALMGYHRLLRDNFRIDTAVGSKGALIAIANNGPYAAVVSDLKMARMDGLQLLCEIKTAAPDTVRILLTGEAALDTAITAINESNIFYFLTKPCSKESLSRTLFNAIEQFHAVIAEREILERTLLSSVQLLVEILSLANPAVFSRAARLQRYMSRMVATVGLSRPWRFEIAALMSQLGCVTLDPDLVNAMHCGVQLSEVQQTQFARHPLVAHHLLENIPRMEGIGWMIAQQGKPAPQPPNVSDSEMAELRKGAELLQVGLEFDDLVRKGNSRFEAGHRLGKRYKNLNQEIILALVQLEPDSDKLEIITCPVEQLSVGMVVQQDVYSGEGSLIVAKRQEVSMAMKIKLESFHARQPIVEGIRVTVAKPASLPTASSAAAKA